jgi:DNA-binding CsgD family transcriptional regulator
MTSIHTNTAAMAVPQTLRSINSGTESKQDDTTSATRVETPSCAAAGLSIPTTMQSDIRALNAAVGVLQMVGLPSAVLRNEGRVIVNNELLEDFAPQVIVVADDSVRFTYAPANKLMSEALQTARTSGNSVSRSFPLPRNKEAPPAVMHLLPFRGAARDIPVSAAFLLIVTQIDRSRVPTVETIQGLFDLTPAEARVARSLAVGSSVAATARHLAVGVETVRTHVKAILFKSGMSRQTDLVAAIASVRPLGEPPT